MNLEHPQLDPFEATLSRLIRIAHTGGISELEKRGLRLPDVQHSPAALRAFLRGCHYGYDLAQRQIAALVIGIEHAIAERTQKLKELRRARDHGAQAVLGQVRTLRNRQIALRRLADSILYTITGAQSWLLRRFVLDPRIRPIDPVVLERTVQVAVNRNRENRLKFNLVSDLTTVMQIGDLVEIDVTARGDRKWSVIELKGGRVNELLAGVIGEKATLGTEDLAAIRKTAGGPAAKQAQRMARQRGRMRELVRIVDTDQGIDPVHEVEIHMTPDAVALEDYCAQIEKAYELAKRKGASAADVDGCLRIFAATSERAKGDPQGSAAHQFLHMANPGRPCAFSANHSPAERHDELEAMRSVPYFVDLVEYNLMDPIADPIYCWANTEMVLDLVAGRVRLFVQFDLDAFFGLAAKDGIKMRWLVGKELEKIKKMSMPLPGSPDRRGIHAELPNGQTQTLLAGFLCRPLANLARPRQLIELIKRWPDQAAKMKRADA